MVCNWYNYLSFPQLNLQSFFFYSVRILSGEVAIYDASYCERCKITTIKYVHNLYQ